MGWRKTLSKEKGCPFRRRAGVGWPASPISFLEVWRRGGVPSPGEPHMNNHSPGNVSP